LSQLSSCMNGEKTAINTIRISMILGNLFILFTKQLLPRDICADNFPSATGATIAFKLRSTRFPVR
jgi:hypothetical protein